MQLISRKNFLIFLAALLVVAMGIMALYLTKKPGSQRSVTEADREIQQIRVQSATDEPEAIEEDLTNTDLQDLDKELPLIESELNATY